MLWKLFRSSHSFVQCLRTPVKLATTSSIRFKYTYGPFTVKDILYDNSDGEAGSLITRFVKYLALESCKWDPLTPHTIKYSNYYPVHDTRSFYNVLKQTPTDQLPKLLVFTYTYKTNGEPQKLVQVLNDIDAICVERIHKMSYETILQTLYSFMFLMPNKITKTEFYKQAILHLADNFKISYDKAMFTQVCFYLGLWKKHKESTELTINFLHTFLNNYLSELNQIDLSIVSNAAFKTSATIKNPQFLDKLKEVTLKTEPKDDAILITLLKSLRLNNVKDEKIYEKLKSMFVNNEVEHFHFKGLVHTFAYFSDGLWNQKDVCQTLITKCIDRLDSVGAHRKVFNDIRAKDVATFLWCSANLCAQEYFNEDDLKFLEEIILAKVQRNEYKYCPDDLIDTCLSLWMLGYQSEKIVSEVFNLNVNQMHQQSNRIRLNSRFRLLQSCIEILRPEWLVKKISKEKSFSETRPVPEHLLKNSGSLLNVYQILKNDSDNLSVKSLKLVSPIVELNIPGILVKFNDDKKCFIEVLQENHILKFDQKTNSLVNLKHSLLEHLGYTVIFINPQLTKTDEELTATITKKLSILSPNDAETLVAV